jgi:hypothetical protein
MTRATAFFLVSSMAPPPLSTGAVVGGFGAPDTPPPIGTAAAPATAPRAPASPPRRSPQRSQPHSRRGVARSTPVGGRGEGAVVSACMQGSSSVARHVLHESLW